MDRKLIDLYESGPSKLQRSIAGLSIDDLLWVPPPDAQIGLWSIQQIVIHLMDADLIGTNRMKSIIAEDHPTILGYDENKFAANLFYEVQNAESSIELLDLNRKQFAKVLRKLPDSTFSRTGMHSERGSITLGQCLQQRIEHIDHHLGFIFKKREKLGKPSKD
jgi:hypothetical protein